MRGKLEELIVEETACLDEQRFEDWLTYLSEDFEYRVPVGITRETGQGPGFSDVMFHFQDTYETMRLRVGRLGTAYAWAENPPSRLRHFVSNFRVEPQSEATWAVRYNVLVFHSRRDQAVAETLTGERRDVWHLEQGRWKLVKRWVYLDTAVLGSKTLSFFL